LRYHQLPLVAITALVFALTFVGPTGPVGAEAEQVHLPIVGRQFITVGPELRGGAVVDWSGDELGASPVISPRGRLGLQHIILRRLSMNLELAAGATYLDDHPMAPQGDGPAQFSFDFSATILGRYMAVGPTSGWTFAGGIHYRRLGLQTGSLLQMGIDGRIGYHFWTGDERFVIVELGLHAPVIEGLSLPQSALRTADEPEDPVPDGWALPSASIGVQWAF